MPAPQKPDTRPLSYDSALAELQELLRQIESDDTGIDQLSQRVKRATELLDFCRQQLRKVETDMEQALIW